MSASFLDDSEFDDDNGESALCLSLSWDSSNVVVADDSGEVETRLISTYSNGCIVIHRVSLHQEKVTFEELHAWKGHIMYHTPAEVWTACFAPGDSNIVLTGGDEGTLKVWDLSALSVGSSVESLSRPTQALKHFEAGVTVLSAHPRCPHLVACGSYDETVAIYDVRRMSSPLCHSDALGGGMWRIKWHPRDDNRLLLGAMHGGCRVIRVDGWEQIANATKDLADISLSISLEQEFTLHKSMAYGADWLTPPRGECSDIAASCSFYDRELYLWKVSQNDDTDIEYYS